VTATALVSALDEAKELATRGEPVPEAVTDLVLRILTEASDTPAVLDALKGASAGRALLRMTDGTRAIEFQAGDGTLFAEIAEPKGKGPRSMRPRPRGSGSSAARSSRGSRSRAGW